MFERKLYPHQEKALLEALACMNTLISQGVEVDTQAVSTIKAMLGIKETISDSMNKGFVPSVVNKRRVA